MMQRPAAGSVATAAAEGRAQAAGGRGKAEVWGAGAGFRWALAQYVDAAKYPHGDAAFWFEDDRCVVISDAYPKSSTHLLLIPRRGTIGDALELAELEARHLPVLRELHAIAAGIVEKLLVRGEARAPIWLG